MSKHKPYGLRCKETSLPDAANKVLASAQSVESAGILLSSVPLAYSRDMIRFESSFHGREISSSLIQHCLSHIMRKPDFCLSEISPFVFATWIVLFLLYLYPKFQNSSFLLRKCRLVCVRLVSETPKTGFLVLRLIYSGNDFRFCWTNPMILVRSLVPFVDMDHLWHLSSLIFIKHALKTGQMAAKTDLCLAWCTVHIGFVVHHLIYNKLCKFYECLQI